MKQKLLGCIAVSMVAVIFFSMLAILPVAHAAPTIYMTPNVNPAITPAIGAKFNITLWCSGYGAPPVFGWQVIIRYNGVLAGINATRAWVGSALGGALAAQYIFAGRGEFAPPAAFIPFAQAQLGSTLLAVPGEVPPPEPALLGIIEFQILAAPNKYETLTTPLSFGIDGIDTYLLMEDGITTIPTILIDGSYTWAWVPPTTNPNMAVRLVNPNPAAGSGITYGENGPSPPGPDPYKLNFDEYHMWNGTIFTAKVVIENLEIGWALHSAAFVVTFNDTLTAIMNIAVDPLWAGPNVVTNATPGTINAFVQNHPAPVGTVLVLTLTFAIQNQGFVDLVVRPVGAQDKSIIALSGIELFDTVGPVPTMAAKSATVTVKCKLELPLPWFEVVPGDIVLGPDLVIGDQFGKEFKVDIDITHLHLQWKVVGIELRLSYDGDLVEVTSIEEGPYLSQFPNNGPPITFFLGYDLPDDPVYGDHVLIGDLLLPNATGNWHNWPGDDPETGPLGSGTIATITFRPIKQSFVDTYNMPLNFLEVLMIDSEGTEVPTATNTGGMVHILPISTIGRRIDVWMQYPSPYGGQGVDQPADMVVPQQIILLTAKVTYNWWPVAQKKVTFNVYDNQHNPVAVLEGITGDDGHAYASYRMPWPNVDPENLFGVWEVIASVSVADVTISDHLMFHYDYLVVITSVTTNKLEYAHLETVTINVQYKTHAIQTYHVVMTATIQDNLMVPVGLAVFSTTVGGSVFSVYKTYASSVSIMIPYWAYAGAAIVRVDFLDKLPSDLTHVAVTPEATAGIYILPV